MEDLVREGVQNQLAVYFQHLAARVDRFVRQAPPDQLWQSPFPFGNSMGNLVLHLTGNLNHFIGNGIAGTDFERNRPAEFSERPGLAPEDLLAPFHAAIEMVIRTLKEQTSANLLEPAKHGVPPVQNRFGMFLVCASHLNNHIGQMVYMMHAWGLGKDERTW